MKVRVIKDFKPQNGVGWIRANELFECRRVPTGVLTWVYQIIEGNHSGVLIDSLHCVELPKEKTYSESEYKLVREERDLLLRQIEKDKQKPLVVIPLKAADAIETLRHDPMFMTNESIVRSWMPSSTKVAFGTLVTNLRSIPFDSLLQALVNGYTVETLESKIKEAVLKLVEERSENNVGYIIANDCEHFSKEVTQVVTQIIREDQAATQ